MNIDFPYNINPKVLLIQDTSCYDQKPEKPVLDILIPGHKHTKRVVFKPGDRNIINASLLGLNCGDGLADLPDGLYYVTYRIYPHNTDFITKPLLQTAQLDNRYLDLLLKLGDTDCDVQRNRKLQRYLDDIDIFIEGARSASRVCNKERVNKFYKKASDLIDKLKGYTDCGCK